MVDEWAIHRSNKIINTFVALFLVILRIIIIYRSNTVNKKVIGGHLNFEVVDKDSNSGELENTGPNRHQAKLHFIVLMLRKKLPFAALSDSYQVFTRLHNGLYLVGLFTQVAKSQIYTSFFAPKQFCLLEKGNFNVSGGRLNDGMLVDGDVFDIAAWALPANEESGEKEF